MNKTLKALLIAAAVLLLLAVGAAIALKMYFTSDRLKAIVIPRVEEATGRNVTVADVSLSIFPRLAVELKDLTISNPRDIQFERDPFLSLDALVLDISIFPLLKNRLEINEIILRKPEIYLEVNKDGKTNYAFGPEAPVTPSPVEERPQLEDTDRTPFTFLLSDFQIVNATIEYLDIVADRRIVVSGYNQKMKVTVKGDGQDAFLESTSSTDGFSYGSRRSFLVSNLPFSTYQRMRYEGARDALLFDSVRVSIREIALVLKGSVTQLQSKPTLDLTLESTRADLAQLLSLVPRDFLKDAEGLSTGGTFQFSVAIRGEASDSLQPEIQGTFAVAEGSVRYHRLPQSITGIQFAGGFVQPASTKARPQPGRFNIDRFSANLGGNTLTGKLGIVNFDDPTLSATFEGELNLAEVKNYYPVEPGTTLAGVISSNLNLAGKPREPARMRASGRLEFRNVTIQTATTERPLRNLVGAITFNNDVIETRQLSLEMGESDLSLGFTMRNYLGLVMKDAATAARPSMSATLTSRQLRTADLIASGTAADPQKPQPRDSRQAQQALLPDLDVDARVTVGKLVTEKFEFTNARGAVKIRSGVVTLDGFSVQAFDGSIITRGTLDLRKPDQRPFNLDLDISNVEANQLLANFTSFGNNLFGRLGMKTSLKGDLNDTLGLNPHTLSGDGRVQIQQGRLVGYPLTMKLADVTGINELRQIEFSNWSNTYRITDGRVHIEDLKILAVNSEFVVSGSQGLDGTLNYRMLVRLPAALSNRVNLTGVPGDVIGFLKDGEGRINLHFLVSGTSSNPSLSLDTREAENAARQALEQRARDELRRLEGEAKRRAEEELKKKAEEELKKLFPRR